MYSYDAGKVIWENIWNKGRRNGNVRKMRKLNQKLSSSYFFWKKSTFKWQVNMPPLSPMASFTTRQTFMLILKIIQIEITGHNTSHFSLSDWVFRLCVSDWDCWGSWKATQRRNRKKSTNPRLDRGRAACTFLI